MSGSSEAKEHIFVSRIDKSTPLTHSIPLHMTALHWFETDTDQDTIASGLREVAKVRQAITARAIAEDMFGPDKDVPVVRLERTPELLDLHLSLLALAKQVGGRLDERWVGVDKWNPHVTHQLERRLYIGDTVSLDDIDLITKRQDGMRQLVVRVAFGDIHERA